MIIKTNNYIEPTRTGFYSVDITWKDHENPFKLITKYNKEKKYKITTTRHQYETSIGTKETKGAKER